MTYEPRSQSHADRLREEMDKMPKEEFGRRLQAYHDLSPEAAVALQEKEVARWAQEQADRVRREFGQD